MIPILIFLPELSQDQISDYKEDLLYLQGTPVNSASSGIAATDVLNPSFAYFSDEVLRARIGKDLGFYHRISPNRSWSIINYGNADSISEREAILQNQLDIAKKETTIALQDAKLRQQRTLQFLNTVFAGCLIIFLGLSYRLFLKKKKYTLTLEKQNREKEFLLKEIHHRVKNNLEIISSLLSLQAAQIEDPNLLKIMAESQNRVHTMGLIHQNLYLGEHIAAVEMAYYFTNLGNYILHTFGATGRIRFVVDMKPLELDIDRAVPIGLIVNELITNSLKYAFPADQIGEIRIALTEKSDCLQLTVADNGIGMDQNLQTIGSGFGSQLIGLLCRQLKGKMILNQEGGTQVFFEFQPPQAA